MRACGRYLMQMMSLIPLGLGFFMIGWTEKKQGLHDMIMKCLVIKKTAHSEQSVGGYGGQAAAPQP